MAEEFKEYFENSEPTFQNESNEADNLILSTPDGHVSKNPLERETDNEQVIIKPTRAKLLPKFPSYPSHGVIGTSEPAWMDIFYSSKNLQVKGTHDFRKQKFDFYETYEKDLENCKAVPTPLPGLANLWQNFNARQNASFEYQTDSSLPKRFRNPGLFQGYGCEKDEHPLFRTTSSAYGQFPPTTHDVPHKYHGLDTTFTVHLANTGMPRNRSLNIK
ncbi:hypothetical protein Ocin01_09731 [Orchesella cincta]|uniref:Uncharacterized protein n=1 Tax=Orchesella cincta TaxID=48709 RepID=A0A1D2MVH6_ORCCI|nr:hypothetical protein Ocin01_09731 [Orchesella cincta]